MKSSTSPTDTSNKKVQLAIEALAARFSEKYDLDKSVIQSLSTGVIDRINAFGEEEFLELNREQQGTLIQLAVKDYFECAEKFHDRFINEEVFRKRVQSKVYSLLTDEA
jgi:hypothetical protein